MAEGLLKSFWLWIGYSYLSNLVLIWRTDVLTLQLIYTPKKASLDQEKLEDLVVVKRNLELLRSMVIGH